MYFYIVGLFTSSRKLNIKRKPGHSVLSDAACDGPHPLCRKGWCVG